MTRAGSETSPTRREPIQRVLLPSAVKRICTSSHETKAPDTNIESKLIYIYIYIYIYTPNNTKATNDQTNGNTRPAS